MKRLKAKKFPVQARYARLLQFFTYAGLGLLVVTFFLYVTGALPTRIDVSRAPEYFHLSAEEFGEINDDINAEWGWVGLLENGDVLINVSLVFLAMITPFCFLYLTGICFGEKKYIYAVIAAVEAAVLTLSATGLISGGL
jgi:hypothetical protein